MTFGLKTLAALFIASSLPLTALANEAKITESLAQVGLTVQQVSPSPMTGVSQVLTDRGLFFMSDDGRFLVAGNVLDMQNWQQVRGQQVPTNLKEQLMAPIIVKKLAEQKDNVIEYKAPKEKYVVHVFTDPSCGYCRKLHSEMKEYLKAGITVRYLAYPRAGVASEVGLQMQHIWCAKDQRGAMDNAKVDKSVAKAMCQNPVATHYELGQFIGVTGTPAVILPDGQLIPGYMPAEAMIKELSAG
ncbi:bifunctional protein-disulfide isomerase/oxidoreductase DsbC [Rheinheimera sp. UJ51]|uniref:bifunctional protein-disulfide isomerase/oxidoreductase DsbC n=1 Tax=Rheinheimera sp. UJ51 TaxID=2892446 RepID=UPI001E32504C|nr:bifunctional protein-disulfide isomerase/oxidoreductase DsbC [Rheinheimera sp. UJ51]MCC5452612.1 bifunctional protein-disulfide isomerase/oxidoreductase DsbC [Rheinheimera sp. UJ51]